MEKIIWRKKVAKGTYISENSSTEEVRTYPLGSLTSRATSSRSGRWGGDQIGACTLLLQICPPHSALQFNLGGYEASTLVSYCRIWFSVALQHF